MILDTLELPNEMVWVDEFAWCSVATTSNKTIQGKPIVTSTQIGTDSGRPVTLSSQNAWATRAIVMELFNWTHEAQKVMSLTMNDNRIYTVRFRHWDQPVLTAPTVMDEMAWATEETLCVLSLKLSII